MALWCPGSSLGFRPSALRANLSGGQERRPQDGPDPFLTADELVAGVSEAMVAFHLSGWHVLAFFSTRHVGPDIEIELFILTRDGATGSTSIDLSADI